MRYLLIAVFTILFFNCNRQSEKINKPIKSVSFQAVLQDSTLSIRALDILDSNNIAFAANANTYGLYNVKTDNWLISKQQHDSLDLEFRAIANNSQDFFMLSVANPALLFKTTSSGTMKLVYKEVHEKVFYDAMAFWNTEEGIAIGDTTDGCLSIIITRNGGKTWKKLPCNKLPKGKANEGAFAASNTNIDIVDNHTWVATNTGRVYYSPNKGKTWQVIDTPIMKDKETEGLYSIDFYNKMTGFGIGGDYTNPADSSANKIRTLNGGKTWHLVAKNKKPGYRSCVQYIPNGNGNELVAVGFKGIDYSNNHGETWTHLSDEGFYTIRFLNDSTAYAAGQGRIHKLLFKR